VPPKVPALTSSAAGSFAPAGLASPMMLFRSNGRVSGSESIWQRASRNCCGEMAIAPGGDGQPLKNAEHGAQKVLHLLLLEGASMNRRVDAFACLQRCIRRSVTKVKGEERVDTRRTVQTAMCVDKLSKWRPRQAGSPLRRPPSSAGPFFHSFSPELCPLGLRAQAVL
jgi:hypothetical protein